MAPMFSCLRAPAVAALQASRFCMPRVNHVTRNIVRSGGHGQVFVIRPSQYQWRIAKDIMHLYILLGFMPTILAAFFMNVFIGPAELADIPEGYIPRYWEYYKHPLTRWLAKNYYWDPIKEFELLKWTLNHESEKIILRKITKRVIGIMRNRQDYQSWFYVPVEAKYHRYIRDAYRWGDDTLGGYPSHIRDASDGTERPSDVYVEKDPVTFGYTGYRVGAYRED